MGGWLSHPADRKRLASPLVSGSAAESGDARLAVLVGEGYLEVGALVVVLDAGLTGPAVERTGARAWDDMAEPAFRHGLEAAMLDDEFSFAAVVGAAGDPLGGNVRTAAFFGARAQEHRSRRAGDPGGERLRERQQAEPACIFESGYLARYGSVDLEASYQSCHCAILPRRLPYGREVMLAVVLAVASAIGFGASDYAAGLATRVTNVYQVALTAQVASLILTGLITPWVSPFHLTQSGAWWGAVAGVAGDVGAVTLYLGFRHAAFSVASTLSAVGSAALSVVAGLAFGERPKVLALAGIALALPAIAAVSASPSGTPP